ncbi:GGDEF domain-containing protein [Mycobacterium sp. 94-17]|uniref:GGDEF domain-containing protein n=1 Tax=Mycobacterium sp. 94-17 TaxID=2986147 RepID=UPI002D1E6120|nr:GGDEF domain-containing protein [Mycobacterium sp. 94-17]MEB4211740.1 GGDEF domain-containing protein [Mycobacterium sp. 94-17]
MSSQPDAQPSVGRWHAIGLVATVWLIAIYGSRAYLAGVADSRLDVLLGGTVALTGAVAWLGHRRGWQHRRALLAGWPFASLALTTLVGAIDPRITQNFPGTITITFAYIGLTCPRWRSLAFVPLGVAAFIVGGAKSFPGGAISVVMPAVMWVMVAEVPAWLIARLEEQSALLHKLAHTDALTQLLDRRALGPQLSENAGGSAVMLIDLDNFKLYNDTHGHEAGDELLVAFADALRWSVGDAGTAFRIGGDEFVVLIVGTQRTEAEQVLARLRERWSQSGAPVGFSAGIAVGGQDHIRLADQHMYANKRARDLSTD